MRMWNINPKMMCRKHLLGEHVEMHMFVGTIRQGKSLQGYLDNKLVIPELIMARHEELVAEMGRRGMNHKSPLPKFVVPNVKGRVDIEFNFKDLMGRCSDCKSRILQFLPESHPLRPIEA